ncbi:MAG: hypothetical protein LDL53_12190 [Candidatus Hydrogenedens sp.]|nr:hypothetical protein [Candidatus Hydrogenedens sp.]
MIKDLSSWFYCLFHSCSYYEKLIITACYEEIDDVEKKKLQTHIGKCQRCKEQYHQMIGFAKQIMQIQEVLYGEIDVNNINLLPQVMSKVTDSKSNVLITFRPARSLALGMAVIIVMVTVVLGSYFLYEISNIRNNNVALHIGNENAKNMSYEGPLENQKEKLKEIIKSHPGETIAGQALLMLADLEYTSSERYDEAHRLYSQLRQNYPRIFSSSQEAIYRYNLLEETKNENFKPLYALNSALSNKENPIRELEMIVSKYPGTMVANLAIASMIDCVIEPTNQTPEKQIRALENLRGYLTEPSAVAQLNYAIGNIYWNQMRDVEKAKTYFQSVAHSESRPLHNLAYDALTQLVSYSE